MKIARSLWVVIALFVAAGAADAASITVYDPTNGGLYTLNASLVSGNTYDVTLTVDIGPANPLLNSAVYIEQVEFKIAEGGPDSTDTYSSVGAISGPGAPTVSWIYQGGPLGANGCGGVSWGFVCVDAQGGASLTGGLTIGSATSFTWTTQVVLADGVTLADEWHIGVHYTNSNLVANGPRWNRTISPQNAGIVSLSSPPIPEPSSAAAFALGALLTGAALRRRLKAA